MAHLKKKDGETWIARILTNFVRVGGMLLMVQILM